MRSALVALALVASLSACRDRDPAPPVAHPDLHCGGGRSGTFEPDLGGQGLPDASAAARQELVGAQERYGGVIEPWGENAATLVVDGRRVLIARVFASEDGGFLLSSLYWCEGFFDVDGGGPDVPLTAPLVSAAA